MSSNFPSPSDPGRPDPASPGPARIPDSSGRTGSGPAYSGPAAPDPGGSAPGREFPAAGSSPSVPAPDGGGQPVGRGQRTAWNTATAVLGGVGALALLFAGAGTAAGVVLTQERDGGWDAPSDVTAIDVDTDSAAISVVTSATADTVEVGWSESGWNLGAPVSPQVSDGTLRITVDRSASWWNSATQQITITVPEKTPTSLELETVNGAVHINGSYSRVRATTTRGSISASGVKASVLDVRASTGQVLLDGVRVTDRLDAHTGSGLTTVSVTGAAPQRSSVTSDFGYYGVAFPTGDYWYPAASQRDFTNPRLPRTPDTGSFPEDTAPLGEGADHEARATPDAATSSGPATATESPRTSAGAYDAQDVCGQAPEGRPCLFLKGDPVNISDSAYLREWQDAWNDLSGRGERFPAWQEESGR